MPPDAAPFEVQLTNFEGPFDLLTSLIAKRRLDITEVALAQVTDEFVAYIASQKDGWNLGVASSFVVVAATLLDLKAASLLPGGLEESEDLELLEARDVLFSRLLQYRAFRQVADHLAARLAEQSAHVPRAVTLEAPFQALLPELVWTLDPATLAQLAAQALARPPAPKEVQLGHLHAPLVQVAEQSAILVGRLRHRGAVSFRDLVADAVGQLPVVVARFVALLDLFRVGQVTFTQLEALGDLTVHWCGDQDEGQVDQQAGDRHRALEVAA
jgi:segregation and condensation protein A